MRSSTRRSISRAAVLGLLSTTPLIAGWAAPDTDGQGRALHASPSMAAAGVAAAGGRTDLDAVRRAAFGELDQIWLAAAPAVDETLHTTDEVAAREVVAREVVAREVAARGAAAGGAAVGGVAATGLTDDEIAAIDTSDVTVTVLRDEQPPAYVTADGESITVARVRAFLDARNAPMADQAGAIVAAGVAHDVDPRVVVGIAIAESNAGERLPAGSHNAWGWGGSGKFGLAHWDSWDEALDTYTERLGALYDTDAVDRSFAETYCPPNWRWWLDTVTWVIDEI